MLDGFVDLVYREARVVERPDDYRLEYVATGKVYWKYMPMILGIFPNAMEAAQAGECAGEQGRFREMQDRLAGEETPDAEASGDGAEGGDAPATLDDGARTEPVPALADR